MIFPGQSFALWTFSFWLSSAAFAQSDSLPTLQSLLAKGGQMSALAVNLRTGETLVDVKSVERIVPASVTKVVLAAAALEKFGSDHTITTKMYRRGPLQGGRIKGDLIVLGAGDPYLTNEKLWFLATDVARAGVKVVEGNLVLNTSLFGKIKKDSNRKAGERASTHAYDAPLSAGAVNFSVMAAVVSAGSSTGSPATLGLEPYALDTVDLAGTPGTGRQTQLSATRVDAGAKDKLVVSGTVAQGSFPARVYRSVSDADSYSLSVFRAFLEKAGVKVLGNSKVETAPPSGRWDPVSQIEGFPLEWQLRGLLKMSNNFIADMWTLQLDPRIKDSHGAQGLRNAQGTQDRLSVGGATLEGGAAELENYLRKVVRESRFRSNSSESGMVLDSGSGLTPENRISARDVVAVLDRMFQNQREFPSFLSALPIPGAEGTVKKRFSEPAEKHLRESIRAKTGTLTEPRDAVGLAGYHRTKSGDWVAFCLLVNGSGSRPNIGVGIVQDSMDADLALLLPSSL